MRKLLDGYVSSNLHVAIAATAMVMITAQMLAISIRFELFLDVLFFTFLGYNYTRGFMFLSRQSHRKQKVVIGIITVLFLLYLWNKLQLASFVLIAIAILLTGFYSLPFDRLSLRSIPRIKIYIVGCCWTIVTHLFPIVASDVAVDVQVLLLAIQRFVLVVLLLLVFDIVDMFQDNQKLKTVPHQLGVYRTKLVAVVLVIVSLILLIAVNNNLYKTLINGLMSVVLLLFIVFSSPFKTKTYTLFWLEAVPILWALLLCLH